MPNSVFDFVTIGQYALPLAAIVAAYTIIAGVLGDRLKRPGWIASARNALYVVCGLLILSFAALIFALVTKDYSVFYVYQNTRNSQSLLYTWTASWGGNSGTLLFWAAGLSIFSTVAVITNWRRQYLLMT